MSEGSPEPQKAAPAVQESASPQAARVSSSSKEGASTGVVDGLKAAFESSAAFRFLAVGAIAAAVALATTNTKKDEVIDKLPVDPSDIPSLIDRATEFLGF